MATKLVKSPLILLNDDKLKNGFEFYKQNCSQELDEGCCDVFNGAAASSVEKWEAQQILRKIQSADYLNAKITYHELEKVIKMIKSVIVMMQENRHSLFVIGTREKRKHECMKATNSDQATPFETGDDCKISKTFTVMSVLMTTIMANLESRSKHEHK